MSRRTPVQIVVLRNSAEAKTKRYLDLLRIAFEGAAPRSGEPTDYLDDAIDLGIHVLAPPLPAGWSDQQIQRLLGAAEHSVVVRLDPLEPKQQEDADRLCDALPDLSICIAETLPEPTAAEDIQLSHTEAGEIEPGMHPITVTLLALERTRQLLQGKKEPLLFFISHAKIDGVPIVISLVSLLDRLQRHLPVGVEGFEYFYDAQDIRTGSAWRNVLQKNAERSVLVAMRTEEYERRHWCQQEYLWAERKHAPILVVDLRHRQYHDGAQLALGSAPSVRVGDGNLIRILLHAIAVHLRALRARYQLRARFPRASAADAWVYLPRFPNEINLQSALEDLGSPPEGRIVHPNPRLPAAHRDALIARLGAKSGVQLMSLDEALSGGSP